MMDKIITKSPTPMPSLESPSKESPIAKKGLTTKEFSDALTQAGVVAQAPVLPVLPEKQQAITGEQVATKEQALSKKSVPVNEQKLQKEKVLTKAQELSKEQVLTKAQELQKEQVLTKAQELQKEQVLTKAQELQKEQVLTKGQELQKEQVLTKAQELQKEQVLAKKEQSSEKETQVASKEPVEPRLNPKKTAVSMNTASAIAGLQPWSKEWVFQGNEQLEPQVQSLFEKREKKAEETPVAQTGRGEARVVQPIDFTGVQAQQKLENKTTAEKISQASSAAAGIDLSAQLAALGGEIEGIEKTAPHATKSVMSARPVKASGSLSGDEFIQTLEGVRKTPKLKAVPELNAGATLSEGLTPMGGQKSSVQALPMNELTGHVVQGSGARERLASASVVGIGSGIRELAAQGGGEIRIRLKPENLGELHLKVVTNGQNVGLQIKASDSRAKAVLEESMSHLRESLATHQLTLASVDLSVSNAAGGSQTSGDRSWQQQPQLQSQQQQSFDTMSRNDGGRGYENQNGERWHDNGGEAVVKTSAFAGGVTPRRVAASGRLDVMA